MDRSKSFGTNETENHLGTLFALCFVWVWDQMSQKSQYLAKMTTNAYFGPNLAVWGQNLRFKGRKQKLWYPHNGKPPRLLVCIVFWSAMRPKGPNMPIFGQKCQFSAKFGRFWAKNPFFGEGWTKSFGTIIWEPTRHLFCVENIDRCGSNKPLGT